MKTLDLTVMEVAHAEPLPPADATLATMPRGPRLHTVTVRPALTVAGDRPPLDREAALGTVSVGEVQTRLLVPADVRLNLDAVTASAPDLELDHRAEELRRALNVVLALLALVALAPVMLVVALLVKLTSPGPVFYTQVRVGQDRRQARGSNADSRRQVDHGGRLFTIYKFRSMRTDAEADGRAVWARVDDDRVTPIGRILRRTRLDELPQLFNVLKGDMNIVGPRPERPCIFAQLRADIAEYPLRQLAKPGITGWAQINLTYDSCIDDVRTKVRYDLEYLRRQGLWEDLRIMAMTVPVMLFRRGSR